MRRERISKRRRRIQKVKMCYIHFTLFHPIYLYTTKNDLNIFYRCLEEASLGSSAYRLRLLFVVLLSHCEIQNPTALFELHWRQMSEHWLKKYDEEESKRICKQWIRRRVRANYGNVDDPLYDGVSDDQHVPSEYEQPPPTPSKLAAKGSKSKVIPC
jgi:hypothetical protein